MVHRKRLAVALCGLLIAACANDDEREPCPPQGLAVASVTVPWQVPTTCPVMGGCPSRYTCDVDCQSTAYRRFACETPQICEDLDWVVIEHQANRAQTDVSFLLTNCSTGSAPLEITGIAIYGDQRCALQNFTDASFQKKVIQPGETVAVHTSYTPPQAGEDFAEVRVLSNATNHPELRLRLCGRTKQPLAGASDGGAVDGGAVDGGAADGGAADAGTTITKFLERCKAQALTQRFPCHE